MNRRPLVLERLFDAPKPAPTRPRRHDRSPVVVTTAPDDGDFVAGMIVANIVQTAVDSLSYDPSPAPSYDAPDFSGGGGDFGGGGSSDSW